MKTLATIFVLTSSILTVPSLAQTVFHNFGTESDFNSENAVYITPEWGVWEGIHAFWENEDHFYWIGHPSSSENFITSRAVKFRNSARIHINTTTLTGSGPWFLTIRYKDNLRPGDYEGAPIFRNNSLLGTLGGGNDHMWKTVQFEIPSPSLNSLEEIFIIGDGYQDHILGELPIDRIQLSNTQNTSEFPEDTQGFWPEVAEENKRFKNIGRTAEYIPGEGAFFPFGTYMGSAIISHGSEIGTIGTGEKETFQIMKEAHFNTVVVHGWEAQWLGDKWNVYPNEAPWASPGVYTEIGFKNLLDQAQGHDLKVIANFLTDTRTYWIDQNDHDNVETLKRLSNVMAEYAEHPALLAWNPVDEWDHEASDYSKPHIFSEQLYKAAKDNSPNRPVYMSLMGYMGEEGWRSAYNSTDIFATDTYFDDIDNSERGVALIGERLDDMRRVLGDSKSILFIPHFVEQANTMRTIDGELRTPNQTEVVMQGYMGITHGAQGLLYFTYQHPDYPDDCNAPSGQAYCGLASSWAGLRQMGEELFGSNGIADALLPPAFTIDINEENNIITTSNNNIHYIAKQKADGSQLLIAVNTKRTTQETRFDIDGLTSQEIPVLFDNRTIPASGESFSDSFGPYERRVYAIEISGIATPSSSSIIPASSSREISSSSSVELSSAMSSSSDAATSSSTPSSSHDINLSSTMESSSSKIIMSSSDIASPGSSNPLSSSSEQTASLFTSTGKENVFSRCYHTGGIIHLNHIQQGRIVSVFSLSGNELGRYPYSDNMSIDMRHLSGKIVLIRVD